MSEKKITKNSPEIGGDPSPVLPPVPVLGILFDADFRQSLPDLAWLYGSSWR